MLDGLLASTGLVGEPAEDFGEVFETQALPKTGRSGLSDHLVGCARRAGDTGVHATKLHLHQQELFLHLLRLLRGAHGLTDAELIAAVFPQPRYVWLKREDAVAQAVSWWRASQSAQWIDSDVVRREPDFDFHKIDAAVKRTRELNDRWHSWFSTNRIVPLVITYEGLVADPGRVVREILSFAGVEAPSGMLVSARTSRQADALSDEWIERYRSLAVASDETRRRTDVSTVS